MASEKLKKLPDQIPNAIELTSFQNSWQGNGLSFYQVLGNVVHLHCSIRNGIYTANTVVISFPNNLPTTTSLAPVFHLNEKAITGYVSANLNGNIVINVSNNTSAVFDLYWTMAQ